jgi:mono/diheme cytochrome c family protein
MAKRKKRRRYAPPAARARPAPPAEPSGSARPRWISRRIALAAAVAVAAVAVVVGVVLARSSHTTENSSPAPTTTPTAAPVSTSSVPIGPVPARRLFAVYCGVCHTLSDAGAVGDDGPDLDRVRPSKARVLAAIRRGGLGSGEMPAGIFRGPNAARVAAYVARATHRR